MTISVTQPNTNSASHTVEISLDGAYIGTIGPGETITVQSARGETEPWHVAAACGSFHAESHGLHDATLHVLWLPNPPRMEQRTMKT